MTPNEAAAWLEARSGHKIAGVFGFGDSHGMADRLLAFVQQGTKRATAGGVADIRNGDPFPAPGMCWGVLDGRGEPQVVIQTTEVRTGRLDAVDAAFAWDEGEYDRTLESWLDAHRRFFRRQGMDDFASRETRAGASAGPRPRDLDDLGVLFERFRVVWPDEDATVWLAQGSVGEGEGECQRAGGRGSEGEGERQRAGGRGSEGEGERQRAGGRGSTGVRELRFDEREWAIAELTRLWGSTLAVSRGVLQDAAGLPGLVAERGGTRAGLLTFRPRPGGDTEIVTINAFPQGRGTGGLLLAGIAELGRRNGWRRIWLITTNDNTPALRSYQRHGFDLVALHRGALERSRQLKPEIPETGLDGIPIDHELELELRLQ